MEHLVSREDALSSSGTIVSGRHLEWPRLPRKIIHDRFGDLWYLPVVHGVELGLLGEAIVANTAQLDHVKVVTISLMAPFAFEGGQGLIQLFASYGTSHVGLVDHVDNLGSVLYDCPDLHGREDHGLNGLAGLAKPLKCPQRHERDDSEDDLGRKAVENAQRD